MSSHLPGRQAPIFEIFVGGGMSDAIGPFGLTLGEQLANLVLAVQSIAEEINEEQGEALVRVTSPPPGDQVGMITDAIFSMIDNADLGVFDMAGPSYQLDDETTAHGRAGPNVMYELSWLHALGVPTIPVIPSSQENIFYLQQLHASVTDDYSVEGLRKLLREKIKQVFIPSADQVDFVASKNPVSNFYDNLSIVEIASSTGLATGYFYNMLRHVLNTYKSPFTVFPNDENSFGFDDFIIFRPKTIEEVDSMKARLDREVFVDGVEWSEFRYESEFHRKLFLKRVGRHIVDVPTPIASLQYSPRYEKVRALRARMKDFGRTEPGRIARARMEKTETAMIDGFFRTVRNSVERPGLDGNRLKFVSVDEFIADYL